MTNEPVLSMRNIKKVFSMPDEHDKLQVLQGISLDVAKGEFVCILGYSGCGKSTLLRIASRLEQQDEGEILLNGKPYLTPSKEVLMLFQDFNQLFPWMTVLKNVMYPLKHIKNDYSKAEIIEKAESIIDLVGLSKFKNSYPHELSGGMKQRIAVARALVVQPQVLLMDEPFAALDATTRANLQELTKRMCAENDVSVLFVTHNVEEAILLGDRIVIMNNQTGKIEQILENKMRGNRSKQEMDSFVGEVIEILNEQQKSVSLVS
ncbi:MAG: ABC transporter ATP-binding protein [Lachnospiraceae bacterium]|nr:ABC transporter ATP-binding protein [Lachnospiraceae bacterium]